MKLNERLLAWFNSPPFVSEVLAQWSDRGRAMFTRAETGSCNDRLLALAEMSLSRKGEVSGAIIAQAFLELWDEANNSERSAFLRDLRLSFGADEARLSKAAASYLKQPDSTHAQQLLQAAEPRRQELLRRINLGNHGTATLVQMREHLLDMLAKEPELAEVDSDFRHLFHSWFNKGFLTLRSIDWSSPANVLEALIRYEAVHEIDGWDELRRRLVPEDRRCFGFFHPQMPDEPLIFVEVALTSEVATDVNVLLSKEREIVPIQEATTAVFYSISNCQRGLLGISLGNFLIKQVVQVLQQECPNLENFVTLSPMPGFSKWLMKPIEDNDAAEKDRKQLQDMLLDELWSLKDEAHLSKVSDIILSLAATYVLSARRSDGKPIDAVARFHLGNGAQVEQINFLADQSPRGMQQSYGTMVNYLYRPREIERNHELYAEAGQITASTQVRRLARTHRMGVSG